MNSKKPLQFPTEYALDHLVIAAANLKQGIGYVTNLLGIPPQSGGQHLRMEPTMHC